MSIFSRGVDVPKLYSRGVGVKRVMVGTGSSSVEAWPAAPSVWTHLDTLAFNGQSDLAKAPVTGFAGSHSSSEHAPGFVFENMFVAGNNSVETNNFRLFPRSFHRIQGPGSGKGLVDIRVTLGNQISTSTSQRSYLVLASDANFENMICVSFNGQSIGLDYFGNPNASWHADVVTTPRLVSGSTMLFKFVGPNTNPGGTFYSVYFMSEDEIAYEYNFRISGADKDWLETFINDPKSRYAGFGVSSTTNSWSPRLDSVQISGYTNRDPDFIASESLARMTVASSSWVPVAESSLSSAGQGRIRLVDATWASASTASRLFRVRHNATVVATSEQTQGPVNLTTETRSFLAGDRVYVDAYSESGTAGQRKISGGVIQIGDLTRFD